MKTVNYTDLSGDVLTDLLDFAGYFHRIGLTKDYQLMLGIYGNLFPDLKEVTRLGIDVVGNTSVEIERDWGKAANGVWKKLEQLEPYAEEAGKVTDYFRVLEIFVQPFQYLASDFVQKVEAYHEKEIKLKHGTAKKFSRIQADRSVKIEHCADCPGGQQQQTNLKGPRTFKANRNNKVKTREQQVQEERERLLNTEEI